MSVSSGIGGGLLECLSVSMLRRGFADQMITKEPKKIHVDFRNGEGLGSPCNSLNQHSLEFSLSECK